MKQLKKSYLTVALALSACGVLFQNCAAAPPPDIGQMGSSSNSVSALTCDFAGRILTSGEQVMAYQSALVAAGGTCVSQMRTCNNGMLIGSFQYGSCVVESPSQTASCNFYGQTIPHGQGTLAYQASSVVGGACVAENRICSNGVLSGTYQYTSCVVDCSFNGAIIGHGTPVVAFAAPSVPAGSTCVSEMRSCNMGNLTGTYAYSSCSVQPAVPTGTASCSFNGTTVLHGASVTAYSTDLAPYGTTCFAYRESRVCNNGTLSGSFTFDSCMRDFDRCGNPRLNPTYLQKSFSEALAVCP